MPLLPTFEEVNAHIEAMEEFVASHLPNTPDLPPVLWQVWGRIHEDLMRFGPPSMPALPASITGIRDVFVEVPPSSRPPVTRIPVGQKASSWLSRNKWSVLGVALGSGLLAGYLITSSGDSARSRPRFRLLARKKKRTNDLTSERREIILLLGADHPFGQGLPPDLLISSHVTPFGIIQGVLPHLRNTNKYLPKSHPSVVILQSVYTLGPGRNGADAIVTTANTTALDVFRRELHEQGVDVFELDIGKIDVAGVVPLGMKRREAARRERHASQVGRTPSSFEVVADAVADVVGERGVLQWWRGSKRPVGAGARTYTLASHLPTRVLDFLISLPRTLVAMRNSGPTIGVPPGNNSAQPPPRIQTTLPPRPETDSAQPSAATPSSSLLSQSAEASPAEEMHPSRHSYNVPAGEVWGSMGEPEPDS
ncbi:hypothetical protein RSAG8_00262, partial [Rhizoctonia solani AG-8 WAC10335]